MTSGGVWTREPEERVKGELSGRGYHDADDPTGSGAESQSTKEKDGDQAQMQVINGLMRQ
jgi:hypothetical protein